MRNKPSFMYSLVFVVPLFWSSSGITQMPPPIPQDDLVRIAEAYHLWKNLGDSVWEDWSETKMSFLLIKQDYEYLISSFKEPQAFAFFEHNSYLDEEIWFRDRALPVNLLAAFPAEGGIPAVIMGDAVKVNKGSSYWVLTALQEMFHVLQMNRGEFAKISELNISDDQSGMWQIQYPFPYGDTTVNLLLPNLAYTLYKLNSTLDKKDLLLELKMYDREKAVFGDYLELKYGEQKNYEYAKFQEWKEGIGDYTEIALAKLAAGGEYRPNPDFTKLSDFVPYAQVWQEYHSQRMGHLTYLTSFDWGRVIFYELGAAPGFLLDKIRPEWKERYFDSVVWLDDIIQEAIQG